MSRSKKFRWLLIIVVITLSMMNIHLTSVYSATSDFRGVNWADTRDNFQSGVIYLSGLSSSDTYSSAQVVADRIVGQMYSLTGANTVRMPINEATVSNYWNTYTGAIDMALSKGKVILCYWAVSNGKPANLTNYYDMWTTVINKYAGNSNCYFEPINEPYGYNVTDLCNFYNDWCNRFSNVPKGRIILDGSGYAQKPVDIGGDSRLSGCLLGYHEYAFFTSFSSESAWQSHIQSDIGSYSGRTVCTEFGAVMNTGLLDGTTQYDSLLNYDVPSSDKFVLYIRAITSQFRAWGMGSVYWPGCRDNDIYRLCTKTGNGSSISLYINNISGLNRIRYGWNLPAVTPTPAPPGGATPTPTRASTGSYVKIRNVATGLFIDGMGRTTNGSNAAQYSSSTSYNQQWAIETVGSYVKIKNRATGLYLDGMGRTSNASIVGQYSSSSSYNQQWAMETYGSNYRFKNRATGLYIDGVGSTSNGADLCQWSNSGSANQQWQIVNP
ncbi:MAG: RICIN domain-containing protein [Firmicutes bacterium]|nr:RICIN domain-containing protein [Bacillota bacterium]